MNRLLWNEGWMFSDPSGVLKEQKVDLPHDAMLLEKRVPGLVNGSATGYYPSGHYVYTKELELTKEQAEETVILEFEGIYQKSTVYLNGQKAGGRTYGYSDFLVDLTGKVNAGKNMIKVEADNSQVPNSRWYTGSGIYRDVYLWIGKAEHILPYGVKLTTKTIQPAVLTVSVAAKINAGAVCRVTVMKDGSVVSKAEADGKKDGIFYSEITVPDARLWTAETPELYDVAVELMRDGEVIDSMQERTGLRILGWSAQNGFTVNGEMVKLRGGCVHHEHGPLGAKSFKDAEVRKMRIMKEAGFNAVRYSHNPAASAFLEACDEVGMYVMDETFDTWTGTKSEYDYGLYFAEEHGNDVKDMIRMAYNHPSVVMYSIGNEIPMMDEEAVEITKELVAICHNEDPSRPVLNAVNPLLSTAKVKKADKSKRNEKVNPRREGNTAGLTGSLLFNVAATHFSSIVKFLINEKKIRKVNGVLAPLDIVGFNYGDFLYEPQHADYPERILVGSETYPKEIAAYWDLVKKHNYVIGDFTWTAWDYLGEAGVGAPVYGKGPGFTRPYPCISAGCSNIDLTGRIKCQGEYFRIVYGLVKKPYLAVHPVKHSGEKISLGSWALTDAIHSWSWSGCEGRQAAVDVYADADCVELLVNGVSKGKKTPKGYIASFETKYEPGKLKAVSYDKKGKVIDEDVLYTADSKTQLSVCPEKTEITACRQSLAYVDISYCDDKGIVDAMADKKIKVEVKGEAELIGLCSGNPFTQYELYGNKCKTYYGHAVAVLRSTGKPGEITVKVIDTEGKSGNAKISSKIAVVNE